MIPPSYSVCCDEAEHCLAADAPFLTDPALLHGIRHWLTLDANPGDHDRLGGRLTGWCCFPAGPYQFVVRLGAAGNDDGRDAYFAHARAWPLAASPADFDPGLYLGQDAAFLRQAPAPGAGTPLADPAPPTCEPLAPILAEKDLATSLIAHLFHGMVTGWPVILGVPLRAFSAESPLARIVACARGALPTRLRQRCRVRVFSRTPGLFLGAGAGPGQGQGQGQGQGEASPVDLLVIPEDLSGSALGAVQRRALLLDAHGERYHGPAPAAGLSDYARAAIEGAQRFPAHLSTFGERFDRLWGDADALPGPDLTDWVTLTFNLAVALAGTPAQRGSLFANFLLTQSRANTQVPWPTLISPQDWARFPQDPLIRFILRADDDRSAGEHRLQAALIDAFQQTGATLDAGLTAWWNPGEATKRRRLLELCGLTPPLISAAWLDLATPLMEQEPAAATALLIQSGAWLAWRRHVDPPRDAAARHRLALAWLTSPALAALREDGARARPPQWRWDRPAAPDAAPVDVTRETWTQVMEDLGTLTPAEVRLLTAPDTHWPWLHPFQEDQARDLTARCCDPDALALLGADYARTRAPPDEAG